MINPIWLSAVIIRWHTVYRFTPFSALLWDFTSNNKITQHKVEPPNPPPPAADRSTEMRSTLEKSPHRSCMDSRWLSTNKNLPFVVSLHLEVCKTCQSRMFYNKNFVDGSSWFHIIHMILSVAFLELLSMIKKKHSKITTTKVAMATRSHTHTCFKAMPLTESPGSHRIGMIVMNKEVYISLRLKSP